MDLNRATIIGNVTRDPEIRTTTSGKSVASFGVATNRAWTDAAGQRQEKAEFHNIVAWGKLAEICGQYLGKGRRIYVEGRLQTHDWEGQDGVKRYRTEIIAENMIMLDRAQAGANRAAAAPALSTAPAGGGSASGGEGTAEPALAAAHTAAAADGNEEIRVEDIPF